jgi:hypothetical protein
MRNITNIAILLLTASLGPIGCASRDPSVVMGIRPQSRRETISEARRDALEAITRGDYRFVGHSGGLSPRQSAAGLPGLLREVREQVARLSENRSDSSIRPMLQGEQRQWQLRYAAMQVGRQKAWRGDRLGWDAQGWSIQLPAIGVISAYFQTCMIEEPYHSRRLLYVETFNREMVSRMDERGRRMWDSVGVSIR